MVVLAIVMIILMVGETIVMINRGGAGGAVITAQELKKYEYIPSPSNYTIMVFTASPKTCPICPELLQNITEAVNILKSMLKAMNSSVPIVVKVFECVGFPQCNSKEALINFKLYGVAQVPLVAVAYRGFVVPINAVGLDPQHLASLLGAWLKLMSEAWKPPMKGVAVLYLYDGLHNSTQWNDLKELLRGYNVTVVALGCKAYPSNCTNNLEAYATMLVLGIRPEQLPLVIVYKDGRPVASYYLGRPVDVAAIVAQIKSLLGG